MNLSNNPLVLVPLGIAALITIILPFLIGFFSSFYFLGLFVSNKKGKFYIKSPSTRSYVRFGISIFIGGISVFIVYNLGTTGYLRI